MSNKQFLESGIIVNTHGVKGELKVEPWSDTPDFLTQFRTIYIDNVPHTVLSARIHKHMVILLLEGVVNQNDAIRYKNKIISINRDDARLDADAWFIEDIIGLPVFDESGAPLGTLAEVLFLPAGQVYVVKGDQEHLVPAVPEFVKNVDLTAGRVTVSLIEGM